MAHIIYADHAATTQLDTAALSAMTPYLTDLYGNPSAPYSAALAPKEALRQARQTIAACIGADADEIFFTGGGTESNNWAIKGTAFAGDFPAPIVTSAIEHHSVLAPCAALQRLGCSLTRLPATAEGIVTDTALEQHLPQGTKLVSVMLANNELGTVQPISSLAAIAHRHGALFHTDAVAAIGRMPPPTVPDLCSMRESRAWNRWRMGGLSTPTRGISCPEWSSMPPVSMQTKSTIWCPTRR